MNERIRQLIDQATLTCMEADPAHSVPAPNLRFNQIFVQLIVAECMAQCEQVAADADAMTKSKFVTDAGRMLHQGMWGGAKNCVAGIKEHFGV
jgi:hypothetical protein